MMLRSFAFAFSLVAVALATSMRAEQISYFTASLTTADPTQLGRASRSGVQQTWTGQEMYTGQLNTTTTYYYTTYDFAASDFTGAPYVEVSAYDETDGGGFFVSAFANSYDPANRGANWLGDEGASGNYFLPPSTDGRYFDVILPPGDNLVLLVNSTLGGTSGLNDPYDIDVAAYADTNYDDPVPVAATPEPGTMLLAMSGLLGIGGTMLRQYQRA